MKTEKEIKTYICLDCGNKFRTAKRDEFVHVQCNYCGSHNLKWVLDVRDKLN